MTDSERRGDDRMPVAWTAKVTLVDDSVHAAEVGDISLAGTLVRSDARVALGDEVVLAIDLLGEFAGKVQWVREGSFGLTLQAGPQLLLKQIAEDSENYPALAAAAAASAGANR